MIYLVDNNIIKEMVENVNSGLPIPLQLDTDSIDSTPRYDVDEHTISYNIFCETNILLSAFTYSLLNDKKKAVAIHRLLSQFLATKYKLDNLILDAADQLINNLELEVEKLADYINGVKPDIDVHTIMMFLMGHELQHARFRFDEQLKEKSIEDVTKKRELYTKPHGFKQRMLFRYVPNVFNNDKLMEEYACDKASICLISEHIRRNSDSDTRLHSVYSQLLWFVTMIQYEKNLQEVIQFGYRGKSFKQRFINLMFDVVRVSNVGLSFLPYLNPGLMETPEEDMTNIALSYNKTLSATLKMGYKDIDLLSTIASDKCLDESEETADKYCHLCEKYRTVTIKMRDILLQESIYK